MKIIIAGINQRDELALKVRGLRGAWFLFLYIEYTSLSKCIPALRIFVFKDYFVLGYIKVMRFYKTP